jgi:hypothetical protein
MASLEGNASLQVSQKLNSGVAREWERLKVSIGCFDAHFRHAQVEPSPAFQGRMLLTKPTAAWNPVYSVRQFDSTIACRTRLKNLRVWSVRGDVRSEVCSGHISVIVRVKWSGASRPRRNRSFVEHL